MFWNFFGRNKGYVDVETGTPRTTLKNRWLIYAIVAAICVLAFGSFGEEKERSVPGETNFDSEAEFKSYSESMERRLGNILSRIEGAGSVEVLISYETAGEKVLAKDKKKSSKDKLGEDNGEKLSESEESTILYGSGSGEKPYVLSRRLPVPAGVLVIAAGAGDENVRLNIYEAVKALYGISGHRIKIATGSVKQ